MSATTSSASSMSDQASQTSEAESLISGWHHVNLLVPPQTLQLAVRFYAGTLGLKQATVPKSKQSYLAWFDLGSSGQQLHINSQHHLDEAHWKAQSESARHPCFNILSEDKLDRLHELIWQMHREGGEGAPVQCDKVAENNGRNASAEFPKRFFARDYAGNRLEFTL